MDVQHESKGPCLHELKVTVDVDQVARALAAATRRVAREVQLPGFRPGHAPLGMVARTQQAAIADAATRRVLEETLAPAMAAQKIKAIGQPRVTVGEIRSGAMFTYSAEVDVLPPVHLVQVEGLHILAPPAAPVSATVERELERERAEGAELGPVVGRDEVVLGDTVLLDVTATLPDGTAVPELAASEVWVDTRAEDLDPVLFGGMGAALVGQRVPGEMSHPTTLPEGYRPAHLAGKEVVLALRLRELKVRVLPPLDDALAQDHGHADVGAWRAAITARIAEEAEEGAERAGREAVWNALLAANPVDVPEPLVAYEVEDMVNEMLGQRASGLPPEVLKEVSSGLRETAERRLKLGLLFEEIAKTRDLVVDDAALSAEVDQRAEAAAEEGPRVRQSLASAERREQLRSLLRERRVMAHLRAHAAAAAAPSPAPAPAPGG